MGNYALFLHRVKRDHVAAEAMFKKVRAARGSFCLGIHRPKNRSKGQYRTYVLA